MKEDRSIFTNKLVGFIILIILIVTVAVAFGYNLSKKEKGPQLVTEIKDVEQSTEIDGSLSKLVLNVQNMSCSGCISTIKGSLSDIKGIRDILVDIGGGKTEIYFDPDKLKDVSRVERAITEAGYPATTQRVVSAEEVRKEADLAKTKSKYYIASVGGYDIARNEFETELNAARKKYEKIYGDNVFTSPQGSTLLDQLKAQIVAKLITEGVFMQEIGRSGYKITADKVEDELQKFFETSGKNEERFRTTLRAAGYDYDYFKKKFETRVLIKSYIDEKVLAEASNPYEKQKVFDSWFNNSKLLADVVYFDKDLELLIRNQSASRGCGS